MLNTGEHVLTKPAGGAPGAPRCSMGPVPSTREKHLAGNTAGLRTRPTVRNPR